MAIAVPPLHDSPLLVVAPFVQPYIPRDNDSAVTPTVIA